MVCTCKSGNGDEIIHDDVLNVSVGMRMWIFVMSIQYHIFNSQVRFSGSLDVEYCEPYSGVNSFIAGPFERCEK